MKHAFLLILASFISITTFSKDWISYSEQLLNDHFYRKSINLINSNINKSELTPAQKSKCYLILADNYLNINDVEKYKKFTTLAFNILNNKTTLDSCLYYSNLSNYYHYLLKTKEAIHHAVKSLDLLNPNISIADSSLIARVYSVYGNSMRNAIQHYPYINKIEVGDSLIIMREHSIKYLRKALNYANKWQKPDVLRKLGTTYNDLFAKTYRAQQKNQEFLGTKQVIQDGFNYYQQAIELGKTTYKNPNRFLSQCYALLGLNHHYIRQYNKADSLYDLSMRYTKYNNEIMYPYEYNAAISWKGWNYDEWYKMTKDIKYLYKSLTTYESSYDNWFNYLLKVGDKNKGLDDAYRVSAFHKIAHSCYILFKATKDTTYINKTIKYSNLDSYPTYLFRKKSKNDLTIQAIQKLIMNDEVLVHYLSSYYPDKTYALIIFKNKIHFLHLNNDRITFIDESYKTLSGFNSIKKFKQSNFNDYKRLFKPIDSLLTLNDIKNVIIVPTSGFAQLNFDLLISDTTMTKWKDYPYMFHKYNFSYALNLPILNDNYFNTKTNKKAIGIIKSNFDNKHNLLFTNKLTNWIFNHYAATISSPSDLKQFEANVERSNIVFLIGHGQGSYSSSISSIYLNDSFQVNSDYLINMNFNNDLFITTACNTNQSSSYLSEGVVGGFTKALMYSGVKSTLTTNWEIDDKTNKIIMERFIFHLSKGKKKSEALWLSKKDYWNYAKQDEEFKPFYWSAYRLTGNTSPVKIKSKIAFNYYYLFGLLVIPIAYIIRKKFN